MSNLSKNLILEGVFASEAIDTAGEQLSVEGCDIADLQSGKAMVNTEHISPKDAGKDHVPDNYKGFQTLVGRVITAKKIFSKDDCETPNEINAFNQIGLPIIYGKIELWDGPEAHDNAKAAAAIARMFAKSNSDIKLGLSVEGSTIEREGSILKRTVIRDMALTLKPANKTAFIDISEDSSPSQVSKSMYNKTYADGTEPLMKSVSMQYIKVNPQINDFGLSNAVNKLRKALDAGGSNSAPSSLTNGSALQKESQLDKLVKVVGKKLPTRDQIRATVPGITDAQLEKIEKALKHKQYLKKVQEAEEIYKNFQNSSTQKKK